MIYQSLGEVRAALDRGETDLPSLVQMYLDNITASSDLNIYVEVWGAIWRRDEY